MCIRARRRNAGIRHKSTLQSATGIQSATLVQKSMGMSAGAFNTREFFHGASHAAMRNARLGFQLLAFAVPILLMPVSYTHLTLPTRDLVQI